MLGVTAILVGYLIWGSTEDVQQNVELEAERKSPVIVMDNHLELKQLSVQTIKPIKKLPPKPLPALTVDEGMQHEMKRVADIYEQRSRYAPYSLYLSAEQTDLINPNQSYESPRAYDIDGIALSILIEPKNYRFSVGQKVEADIRIESSPEGLNEIER